MEIPLPIQPCSVVVIVMRNSFKLDAKEVRTFISSIMVDATSRRFGEMISCHAVYIFDTVYWQLGISVILLTTIFWIILSSETKRLPSGRICRQQAQASWKRSLLKF